MPFLVHVTGRLACFPRPEFVSDKVSYDVITPIAARRILEAVYWRREIRWLIDAIHVLAPIRFGYDTIDGVRLLDPIGDSILAGQLHEFGQLREPVPPHDEAARRIVLLDPAYLIEARFEMTSAAGNPAQHTKMFARALRHGRYFREPYLGLPGYPAKLMLIESQSASDPPDYHDNVEEKDLGWMVHDLSPADGKLRFFRPRLVRGTIRVPPPGSLELMR